MTGLPSGWERATLSEVCLPVAKRDPRATPEALIEYIDIGGVVEQRIIATKTLAGSAAPSRARQIVRAGDTVISTVRTYLRKTALVPPPLDGAIASTGFCVLRPGPALDPGYLFLRCIDSGFVARLTALQTGSNYPAVRDRDVLGMDIEIPPMQEQRRIVAAIEKQFSRADAAENWLHAGHRRAETLSRRIGSLEVDARWPQVTLGDVTEAQSYGSSAKADRDASGIPVLRMGNIRAGQIVLDDLKYLPRSHPDSSKFALAPGDLLFNRTNSPELVGKSAVFPGAPEPMAFASYLIRVKLTPICLPEWASLVINGPLGRRYIAEVRTQQVGQANVNGTKLAAMPLPLPPLDEQRRALAEVEHQLSLHSRLRSAIAIAQRRSAALRRAILERAFRGELVPRDPSDEPASVLLDRIRAERAAQPTLRRGRRAGATQAL